MLSTKISKANAGNHIYQASDWLLQAAGVRLPSLTGQQKSNYNPKAETKFI